VTTKTYTLAATFADDHWERECGLTDLVVKRTKNRVTVVMDAEGYSDMLSDADYYWDMRDETGADSLSRSAKRVLDALLQAGPPEGYVVTRRGYSYRVDPITPVPA